MGMIQSEDGYQFARLVEQQLQAEIERLEGRRGLLFGPQREYFTILVCYHRGALRYLAEAMIGWEIKTGRLTPRRQE